MSVRISEPFPKGLSRGPFRSSPRTFIKQMLCAVLCARSKKVRATVAGLCVLSPVGMQGLEDGGMLEQEADSDLQPWLELQGEAPKTSRAGWGRGRVLGRLQACRASSVQSPQDSISQGGVNGKSDLSGARWGLRVSLRLNI